MTFLKYEEKIETNYDVSKYRNDVIPFFYNQEEAYKVVKCLPKDYWYSTFTCSYTFEPFVETINTLRDNVAPVRKILKKDKNINKNIVNIHNYKKSKSNYVYHRQNKIRR